MTVHSLAHPRTSATADDDGESTLKVGLELDIDAMDYAMAGDSLSRCAKVCVPST
jgi:hypothetical protein